MAGILSNVIFLWWSHMDIYPFISVYGVVTVSDGTQGRSLDAW